MSGSRPLPDAVTRSTGISFVLLGSTACSASTLACTCCTSAGLFGPRLDPVDDPALYATSVVAEGRPQKYCGDENGWPICDESGHMPVVLQEVSVCLGREYHLCNTGDNKRVQDSHDEREQQEDQHCWFYLSFYQCPDRIGSHRIDYLMRAPAGVSGPADPARTEGFRLLYKCMSAL